MVVTPGDKVDRDDYDNLRDYIAAAWEEGYTIEGSDFEGRPCSFCGDLLDFAEWVRAPDTVTTWDIRVQDPDQDEPEDVYARYYFCSEECRSDAMLSEAWLTGEEQYGGDDRINKDEIEGYV